MSGETPEERKERYRGYYARLKADPVLWLEWRRKCDLYRKERWNSPEQRKKIQARRRKKRENPENWAKAKWAQTRIRARSSGIKFDLTEKDIYDAMPIGRKCPILGKPFVFGPPDDLNPSIDRLIPANGYTKENIRIIAKKVNVMKSSCIQWLRSELENAKAIVS